MSKLIAALSEAVQLSFGVVPKTARSEMVAIDVSGSMRVALGDFGGLQLFEAAACMALACAHSNPNAEAAVWSTNWRIFDVRGRRLDDVVKHLQSLAGAGTDFNQAIRAAAASKGDKPELLSIFTDNETWAGQSHPEQEWEAYKRMVPNAKCVVASMTATGKVAMPKSADCLQVVGFDTALPEVIAAFAG